jgi:hypothetical protein
MDALKRSLAAQLPSPARSSVGGRDLKGSCFQTLGKLCWHEGFEHAADAAPDALDVLRAGSGSAFDAAGFFATLLICCAFVRAEAQWRPL